jgi:hypothetical protein
MIHRYSGADFGGPARFLSDLFCGIGGEDIGRMVGSFIA